MSFTTVWVVISSQFNHNFIYIVGEIVNL